MDSESNVIATPRGLYCPAGDFHIDPERSVATAVITHAHGDHLRRGHGRYILARPGLELARSRLPRNADILALEYGAAIALRSATVSLHPAGHILGSAQVRIEVGGRVCVVSGDYKRQPDPTCAPFEPVACDVFVSEATFALPLYRWPPTAAVIEEIVRWWGSNRERGIASVLYCYALGKAQRVLAEIAAFAPEPILVHPAMMELVALYRSAGIAMAPTLPATTQHAEHYRGALILAPPSAARGTWIRRVGERSSGFCSGWMQVYEARRRGYDRGFVLSDHADWPALLETCLETGARQVLLTHGHPEALARSLVERGIDARPLPKSAAR